VKHQVFWASTTVLLGTIAACTPRVASAPAPTPVSANAIGSTSGSVTPVEAAITKAVDRRNAEGLVLLERLVNINSGTMNFAGVRQVGGILRGELDALGFETRWEDGAAFGRAGHLIAERSGKGPRLLLIGHLDTVFEPTSHFQKLEHLTDSTARGPGVIDMKGGDVAIILALRALADAGELNDLNVKAGMAGILQLVPVERGQQVGPGTNLARVANPSSLKAEVRIAETQTKDIRVGQSAEIDTRNGLVKGHVSRIDPASQGGTVGVDISLDGPLPPGSRPDLSVDGTVLLERLTNVVFMGRPAFGQENSTVTIFKVLANGEAHATKVKLGRASVNVIEVLEGLQPGDQVILSDMSQFDAFDRVQLKG